MRAGITMNNRSNGFHFSTATDCLTSLKGNKNQAAFLSNGFYLLLIIFTCVGECQKGFIEGEFAGVLKVVKT